MAILSVRTRQRKRCAAEALRAACRPKKVVKKTIKSKSRFASENPEIFKKQLRTAELLERGEGDNPWFDFVQ